MLIIFLFFFFNVTATTKIYTLSLHDALPIYENKTRYYDFAKNFSGRFCDRYFLFVKPRSARDRKSTRLNSSHTVISYAVFCLKKKNKDIVQGCSKHKQHFDALFLAQRTYCRS